MESDVQAWIQIVVGVVTAIGVLFNIRQVLATKRASVAASDRAETAAYTAARHAQETTQIVSAAAANIQKIELQSNSMMAAARELALKKAAEDEARAHAAGFAEGRRGENP